MRESYIHKPTRAVLTASASLTMPNSKWWVNRINVPEHHRGKGIASCLLTAACCDADLHSIMLRLHASPDLSGKGLNQECLIAFYERHGFKQNDHCEVPGNMIRYPRGFGISY